MIKFLDLKQVNSLYEEEFKQVFANFLNEGQYILGKQVEQFEKEYASYCGTKYCIGVSNGLDALTLVFQAYKYLGLLKEGDEVLVPANTYIATILAISNSGLKPIMIDACAKTNNIDVIGVEAKITPQTKAILGVHLYGQLCNVEDLERIVKENNLLLIEDAAQAHGAVYKDGRKAGNLSNAAAFSFYPTKNLGALGDAGAITTNNSHLAEVLYKLRNYGRVSTYKNEIKGFNCRLDELQAAFLRIKLKYLEADNTKRQQIAKYYLQNITNSKIISPYYSGGKDHVFHQFVIMVDDRKDFINYMEINNIEVSIHYPIPPHKQKAYIEQSKLKLPITEKHHNTVVSLPVYPVLSEQALKTIVKVINKY